MKQTVTTSAEIELNNLSKRFDDLEVIPPMSACLHDGEFTVILGPSGCGKSTLLNMIAGLEVVSGGKILIGGVEMQDMEPKDRGCAMVFQNYALYPHMSVAENIGYSLKVAKVNKAERSERVVAAARFVSLEEYLDRRPGQLSGGQRQRVAIARAIVREPKVMLFDEPLSNLDAKLRHEMRMELSSLHKRIKATSVFVTHDQVEAMTLADRIMVLNKGQIEQFDKPSVIYNHPASTFVANFIGSPAMNLINVTGDGSHYRLGDGSILAVGSKKGDFILGIRPEHVAIQADGPQADVTYIEDLGSHFVMVAQLSDGQQIQISRPHDEETPAMSDLKIRLSDSRIRLFDPETQKAIS
ncbi:sn-glycerol-3-phosphate ABC transporter ATP-binding protein UgpC [uncultured Cohaesibacter sp.]|uniref:ABC transporter ATP-binding protein n=1 Tax=uncultured Cohaesibacter sp. TaxID=1002546 RepID=UPI00293005E2|nr:sn-glycerol-3-phosphate ABC transporter ATP-binding protein UgpC [uncultured Cohaesibacter sp.]